MIRIYLAALLILFGVQISHAQAQDWQLDKSKSKLAFSLTSQGSAIGGTFNDFDADITLNPEEPSGASIKAVINVASLDSSDVQANATALSGSWLAAKNFPTLTYTSTKVTQTGEGQYKVDGILAVKELKKPFSFPFQLVVSGEQAKATASFKIDRASFNLGNPGDAGPEISIKLTIVASKK